VTELFDKQRILVIGDLMLDRYWHGETARISPEAPVPVVRIKGIEDRAGGAGNVALNVSSLGAQATVIGIVGKDEAGAKLETLLATNGCTPKLLISERHPTITKLRVISRQQQLLRLDFEEPLSSLSGTDLQAAFTDHLPTANALVLSDYAKGTITQPTPLIHQARTKGIPVVVDPKHSDFSHYRGASVITPNLHELQLAVGSCQTEEDLVYKGTLLMQSAGLDSMLITRSERGMTLLQHHAPPLHLPANAREVFDVTGAGDTVVAVLATALAAGNALPQAAHLANLAAGIVVGRFGTATVTRQELLGALGHTSHHAANIVDERTLLQQVQAARSRGARIVMTNGCFDILHPGHVSYLEQARALGDVLIVAVNDDASVRKLKGNGRPINRVEDRMSVLASLRSVSWVVPFSADTPEALICKVLPDVLVKGGDYRPDQIAGHQCVSQGGGQVLVLPFLDGCSTTKIIGHIKTAESSFPNAQA